MRCCHKVCDPITKRWRMCKKSKFYSNFCWNHSNLKFYDKIVKIQSAWRSYKVRKKVKNIVKKVPEDVRSIILQYVQKEFYDELKEALYFFYMYVNRSRKLEEKIENLFTRYMNNEMSHINYVNMVNFLERKYQKTLNLCIKLKPKVRLLVDR